MYETDEEVFKDHFGFIKEDPEEGFEKFMHHMTGDNSYDPSCGTLLWMRKTKSWLFASAAGMELRIKRQVMCPVWV